MAEKQNYYKLYGEETGRIAGTVNGEEKYVRQICDEINSLMTENETITYAKIEKEEYNNIQKCLESKIMKDGNDKPINRIGVN